MGKIEAYISIASYRSRVENYCLPTFVNNEDRLFEVKNALHPLLEKGVPNSITLNKKGVILTGSNMSGKSTFMRTLALNILLSQSIYTCLCDEYKASFFRVISSLSISDDVLSGTSYYLEECNSVLRILNSLEDEIPAFCIRRPALRRNGGVGARGVRRGLHAAGDADRQVRRRCRPHQGLRGHRARRRHVRGRHPGKLQRPRQGDAGARAERRVGAAEARGAAGAGKAATAGGRMSGASLETRN